MHARTRACSHVNCESIDLDRPKKMFCIAFRVLIEVKNAGLAGRRKKKRERKRTRVYVLVYTYVCVCIFDVYTYVRMRACGTRRSNTVGTT